MEISQGEATASSGGNLSGGAHSETPSVTQAAAREFQDEGSPELMRGNDAEHDGDKVDEGDVEGIPEIGKVKRPFGRGKRKARKDDEDESAYSEDESEDDDSSDGSYSSVQSEEYDSDEDEDYDDDEEYEDRPKRGRPPGRLSGASYNRYPMPPAAQGSFYQQWINMPRPPPMGGPMLMPRPPPMMMPRPPMGQPLPPYVNPAVIAGAIRPPAAGVRPALTAEQLAEIAKSTIASLVGASRAAPAPAADGVTTPSGEGGESKPDPQVKAVVSDELKNSITNMLVDPHLRAALMQKLYANQMAKAQASGQPMPMPPPHMMSMMRPPPMMPMMQRPPMMMYPPMPPMMPRSKAPKVKKYRAPMRYQSDSDEVEVDGETSGRSRRRSAARKVNFNKLYQEEEEVEKTLEELEQYDLNRPERSARDMDQPPKEKSNRGRKKKVPVEEEVHEPASMEDEFGIQPIAKKRGSGRRSKQASDDEFDEQEEVTHEAGVDGGEEEDDDEGPTVSKILSHRLTKKGQDEFLVKFHGLSYLHLEWISREEMLEAKMGGSRIKKFLSKPLSAHHYDDKHAFNPDYTQIDRVISGWEHPELENPNVMTASYLIKWKSLPYEEATWEKKEDVEGIDGGKEKIAEWLSRPTLESRQDPAQMRIGQRPLKSSWQAMPESPVYKNGNILRAYQLEGINWLVYCWINKQSCIIADEMGLGKTVQSVAFLQLLQSKFNVKGPFLIVAPLSTIPHWEREFQAWTDMNVIVYHGSMKSRDLLHEHEFYYKDDQDRIIPNVYKFDVLITTYEMALAGFDSLQPIIWRAGIFDEAHRLKNRASKAAEVLAQFRLEHKVLLTGTPLQNNLEELYSLLHFLQPQRFESEEDFLEEYGNLERSEDVQKLQELLRPLMLRRLKEDVEKSIPVKEETVIEVELTALQKRYYRAILERNFAFLTKGSRGNNAPNLVNTMMELRKCCIHPYLIKGAEDQIVSECQAKSQDEVMSCMIQSSGKLVLVDKLLKKLREQGRKVLIFSQMTRCLDLLSDYLAYRGYPWERIDGAVKGEDRQAAIDRFCDPSRDSFVFLLCTRAGGVGINLTVADTVVIYDSDWNPQNDIQAQARCHRIGQDKSVKVYRLITRNTYEREMFDKAGLKLGLDKAILQRMVAGQGEGIPGGLTGTHGPQLSKKEVETLLKKGAYGLLMEGGADDDSRRFCEEDIDQILERRTQVIRHGADAVEAGGAGGAGATSLFSKATFAATADDYDVDLDDPNFWELWAKRLHLDPKAMLQNSGGVAVDEPRIRRQLRRVKAVEGLPEETVAVPAARFTRDSALGVCAWQPEERRLFLATVLKYGLRLDKLEEALSPRRSHNDLVACVRAFVKWAVDQAEADDRYFKEDYERSLLSGIDFDRSTSVDEESGKVDLVAAEMDNEEEDGGVESDTGLEKGDLPFPNASKQQSREFVSFLRKPVGDDAWLELVRGLAPQLLPRAQLMAWIREIVESNGEDGIPAPPLPGAAPREDWAKADDQALLKQVHLLGLEEALKTFEGADTEVLLERLVKLVSAITKRTQAAAKLAMHQATTGLVKVGKRRRAADRDESDGSGSDDGGVDDEEYEEEAAAVTGKKSSRRGRGSNAVDSPARPPNVSSQIFWSRRDQQEFFKVVLAYGLPHGTKSESDGSDWIVFSQLGDFSAAVLRRSPVSFETFKGLFLDALEKGAAKKDTRSTRHKAAESDGGYDDEEDEEIAAALGKRMVTVPPKFGPAKAKEFRDAIDLFSRLRSTDSLDAAAFAEGKRRPSGWPRWWEFGKHDLALMKGVSFYGLARPDLIIADQSLDFYSDLSKAGLIDPSQIIPASEVPAETTEPVITASGRKKRSTRAEMSAKFRLTTLPNCDALDLSKVDWPSQSQISNRLRLLLLNKPSPDDEDAEAAEQVEEPPAAAESPTKKKRAVSPRKKQQKTLFETVNKKSKSKTAQDDSTNDTMEE